MRVDVLHIDDCPSLPEVARRMQRALDELGLGEVPVEFVLVRSDEEPVPAFRGSPTILVDGEDLFAGVAPAAVLAPIDLACRIYPTAHGFSGVPTTGDLVEALRRRIDVP